LDGDGNGNANKEIGEGQQRREREMESMTGGGAIDDDVWEHSSDARKIIEDRTNTS
jgi:hypothetical protein